MTPEDFLKKSHDLYSGCMQGPEEKEPARKAPATRIKPSTALLIEGFKRPFTDRAAAALISEHGETAAHSRNMPGQAHLVHSNSMSEVEAECQ